MQFEDRQHSSVGFGDLYMVSSVFGRDSEEDAPSCSSFHLGWAFATPHVNIPSQVQRGSCLGTGRQKWFDRTFLFREKIHSTKTCHAYKLCIDREKYEKTIIPIWDSCPEVVEHQNIRSPKMLIVVLDTLFWYDIRPVPEQRRYDGDGVRLSMASPRLRA